MSGKVYAIVPARGGSKGIPRKNIQTVGGVPLVARSILAARGAKSVHRVVVSTDSDEIASVASHYGAEIVRRPENLSGDVSSSEAALLHALDTLGEDPELVVFIQCTSPFLRGQDIDGAIETLHTQHADSCFSAAVSHKFLWKRGAAGNAIGVNHDGKTRPMRQQRGEEFAESGAVYVMRTAGLRANGFRFFGKTVLYPIEEMRSLEIDTVDELVMARALAVVLDGRPEGGRSGGVPFSSVRAVVMDFDGVFTDDRVLVSQDGTESVMCSRSDGFGLEMLRKKGVRLAVISREKNAVVRARCEKLGIEVYCGVDDKLSLFRSWCVQNNLVPANIAYVGNDLMDIECLHEVGLGVAPADAHPLARQAAHLVLESRGGNGALRELASLLAG
jgi:N-acylneuraminate cytidylyltransferase